MDKLSHRARSLGELAQHAPRPRAGAADSRGGAAGRRELLPAGSAPRTGERNKPQGHETKRGAHPRTRGAAASTGSLFIGRTLRTQPPSLPTPESTGGTPPPSKPPSPGDALPPSAGQPGQSPNVCSRAPSVYAPWAGRGRPQKPSTTCGQAAAAPINVDTFPRTVRFPWSGSWYQPEKVAEVTLSRLVPATNVPPSRPRRFPARTLPCAEPVLEAKRKSTPEVDTRVLKSTWGERALFR
jgi:hypothetical protein